MGAMTIWLFTWFLEKAHGRTVALVGGLLLATDTVFLVTTCFDWGRVAPQHLLALQGACSGRCGRVPARAVVAMRPQESGTGRSRIDDRGAAAMVRGGGFGGGCGVAEASMEERRRHPAGKRGWVPGQRQFTADQRILLSTGYLWTGRELERRHFPARTKPATSRRIIWWWMTEEF
jgi:hypothetical protein